MYIPNRAEQRLNVLLSGEKFSCQGKSAPAPPDYKSAAEATAASDKEALRDQTYANRPNQYTPFGSTTWEQSSVVDPTTGEPVTSWEQYTNLNPESQAALDAQFDVQRRKSEQASGLYERVEEDFKDPMDYSGLPDWKQGPEAGNLSPEELQRGVDFSGAEGRTSAEDARQNAEDAIYGRATSRLDPQWEQRTSQAEARLAAQGLRPDDPAYKQAMENLGRERTDAYQQAQYGSIMGGGQEASRTIADQRAGREQDMGEMLRSGQFANTAAGQAFGQEATAGGQNFAQGGAEADRQNVQRQQQLTEMMQQRGFNLNEINALLSGQQVGMPSMPQYNQAGRGAATDYTGAARDQYQGEQDQFSADQAMWNSLMQGAGMAGGSMAMMSDRRLKRFITRIGTFKRYPMYLFQYIWGEWAVGVMADEINQDAVIMLPHGYAAVDYARIK